MSLRTFFRRREVLLVLAVLCAILSGLAPELAAGRNDLPVNYQKVADGARWEWDDARANPLACAVHDSGGYRVTLSSDPASRAVVHVAVSAGGKELYAWRGHEGTVFRIVGDRLYYVLFNPAESGGTVVAVDLAHNAKIWKIALRALGPVAHSTYQTQFRIEAAGNPAVIVVYGNESLGRYIEILDTNTGRTVGHKVFPG